jgi:EAL domain-containing protein (putative c-di-GMP-specific phosphodiesterase class I)
VSSAPSPLPAAALADALARGQIRSVYQPIVRLSDRAVVAHEALARGPRGSAIESPAVLFAVARDAGLYEQLEWACRSAAMEGALDAGLPSDHALFVNVEPSLLGRPAPPAHRRILEQARRRLRLFFEITERAIDHRPADLLPEIEEARAHLAGIALDDVGVNPASLALMPLVRADVIKLDLRLVQDEPTPHTAQVLNAVLAEAERSGAAILAEGIETEQHLERALAFGATLGQGWLFGRPGPLPGLLLSGEPGVRFLPHVQRGSATTPYDVVSASLPVRRGRRDLLLAISMHFEHQARTMGDAPVVLGTFQMADQFTRPTAARYARLAERSALVAAFAHGLPAEPAPGVRGASIERSDRLIDEWSVVVLGPHFAGALVARDLGDQGPPAERRFDFAITHDRALVTAAAASLVTRIVARR